MKISIVTISFNQKLFLEDTIKSVLSQQSTLFQIEYIVVDPGSTDGSRELITSYGDQIIQVFEDDNGPADGLNKGFSIASGDIYYFLNSDDVLLPNSLAFIHHYFSVHSNVDVLMAGGYLTNQDLRPFKRVLPTSFTVNNYLYGAVSFIQQGTFFKADSFKAVNGFNVFNCTCWDGELFLSMAAKKTKFKSISTPLAFFRIHDEGITGSGRLTEVYNEQNNALFLQYKGRHKNSLDNIFSHFLKIKRVVINFPMLLYIKFYGLKNDFD